MLRPQITFKIKIIKPSGNKDKKFDEHLRDFSSEIY